MNEFDKIKELSEDIVGRKEPSFTEDLDDADAYHFDSDLEQLPPQDILENRTKTLKYHLIGLSALAIVLILILCLILFVGNSSEEDKLITISPTPDPVRVKPEQPGGLNIPDQDKLVYNRVTQNAHQAKVENLFPEPEKPVLPEILIQQNTPDQNFINVEDIEAVNPLEETIVIVEEESQMPKKEALTLKEPSQEKASKTKVVKATEKKATLESWRVQLLSTSKKGAAEKAWPDILKKNKALLSDMSHDVVSAEIPGKGTFYRLQAGKFTTRDMAASLCSKLKAKKQECVPVKSDK